MPAWSHLHPAVVHFPIALLLVVPPLALLGLLWPTQRKGIHACTLAVLALGTGMALLAVVTGMAVPGPLSPSVELQTTLESHERMAKVTALLYVLLTLAFLGIQGLSLRLKAGAGGKPRLILQLLWLAASLGASLPLIQTGHLGGRLVHELGIHRTAR
jgi:uncharacterized membrane protein